MSLTTERRVREEKWTHKEFPLAAVKVWQGGIACIDVATGYCTKGAVSTTLKAIGIFDETVDNSGGNAGDLKASVRLAREITVYRFVNGSNADAIVATDIGKPCYFLDDQTVSIVSTAHSMAGIVWDVDTTAGVAVELFVTNDQGLAAPTITSFANATHTHNDAAGGGLLKLATGATLSFTANDIALTTPSRFTHYKIPSTGAASTVSLGTTGATRGDQIVFTADGTANGHTVTYQDGATAISAAATASKRHQAICTYDGSKWMCSLTVGP